MEAVDSVGWLVPATFFILLAIEPRWPARAFPLRRTIDAAGCIAMNTHCGD